MSPRGFYSKEVITPYFTSSTYRNSDQGKAELAAQEKMINSITKVIKFPWNLATKVWILLTMPRASKK